MRKTNKTLKVTRSIVLLLCCIIFFSSFSAVYALGLGKHNNVWDNLGDDLGGSQTDTYPYNRIGQSDWSGNIKSVGMDVLYGTTHGIVLYYGEVPHDETFSKDKRIDAWNGYPYRENTSIAKTKDSVDPNVYWGTKLDKTEVLYVGDSDTDVQTAINAKIKCAWVSWGYRSYEEIKVLNPDYLINHPNEILDLI